MIVDQNPHKVIERAKKDLWELGKIVPSKQWQGVESPDDTFELLNQVLRFSMEYTEEELVKLIRPNMPWAKAHFLERVSGLPLNPPPSHADWPFGISKNSRFTSPAGLFSHTYPERFWPKNAGKFSGEINKGIRYNLGDLDSVINLLNRDIHTRQAYIPIWYPEDTGAEEGQRVPCTLGYHVIIRGGFAHINYYIRSCDIIRHFRDDLYFTAMLLHYILGRLEVGIGITPGWLTMYVTSLHCFDKEKGLLKLSKT